MIEFPEYHQMRDSGCSAIEVYRSAKAKGMRDIPAIRMLREVFGLTLGEAKEVLIVGSGVAGTVEEHDTDLAAAILDLEADESEGR